MNHFNFNKNKIIIIVIIFTVFISLITFSFFKSSNEIESDQTTFSTFPNELKNEAVEVDKEIPNEEIKSNEVYVDVKGAILKPNVYKLEDGNRVQDVIQIAGGFLENANQTKINLAARIYDEMVIYVPEIGEEIEGDPAFLTNEQNNLGENKGGQININTATSEQLQTLPGIGAAKAASIISYRDENGRFEKIEDLVNVSGIGEKSFEKLKDKITIH